MLYAFTIKCLTLTIFFIVITKMPARTDVSYFGAGPAPLPTTVLEAGARAFVNYENSGLSLAEISHRSPTATKILADTKAALISLLDIPDNYEVLFMHGGGSGEFSAVVFNMVAVWVEKRRRAAEKELGGDQDAVIQRVRKDLREDLRLDYLVTGSWSLKASQEAAQLLEPLGDGFVNIATDARQDGKFGAIPPEHSWKLTANQSAFVYLCDNETVDGVEFPSFPESLDSRVDEEGILVVADMSSNFLSRKVDVNKYAVIFGGAQKNIGQSAPSGSHCQIKPDIRSRYYRRDPGDRAQGSFDHSTSCIFPTCSWGLVTTCGIELAGHRQE